MLKVLLGTLILVGTMYAGPVLAGPYDIVAEEEVVYQPVLPGTK